MPDVFRALIISDIHAGSGCRFTELSTSSLKTPSLNGSLARLNEWLDKAPPINAAFMLGDFTQSSKHEEVLKVQSALSSLLTRAKLTSHTEPPIAVTLGNHDVAWDLAGDSDTAENWTLRFDRLNACIPLRKALRCGDGELNHPPYCGITKLSNTSIISINSSTHSSATEAQSYGLVADVTWEYLASLSPGCSELAADYRVCLIHHHVRQPTLPTPIVPDFSALQEADRLLAELARLGIDIVCHGHTHYPAFRTESIDGGRPMAIFGAGAFAARLPDVWCHRAANCLHLLEIDSRDEDSNCIQGRVITYRYCHPDGWVPADPTSCGIHHVEPFGSLATCNVVAKQILTYIQDAEGHLFTFSEIQEGVPALRYVRPTVIRAAMKSLEEHHGLSTALIGVNDWVIKTEASKQ